MTIYNVYIVRRTAEDLITSDQVGTHDKIDTAMSAAKKVARCRKSVKYGPMAIAYVGREVTAVVSW